MNNKNLYNILKETTKVYRKGKVLERRQVGNIEVIELFGYEHTNKAPIADNFDKVDLIFVDVVVDRARAEKYRNDLTRILRDYPQPERLALDPSYIELASNLEIEQESTLRLMALGKVLGLWSIISGKTLGLNEEQTKELAGRGFILISSYNPRIEEVRR